ncbi:MAG: beta-propeller fold lactonase family protein [Isosphaeraceae bacterium]
MKTPHFCVIVLVLFGQTTRAHAQGPLLLVANKGDDTVSFIDLDARQVVGLATTGRHPHELAVTPDGRTAFVANYGAGDSISVIDVQTRKELRKISLGTYRDPHGIQVSRDGAKVYATCEASRVVIVIDVARGEIIRALDTGREVSHMLVLTPDETRLYAADLRSGSATAINLSTGKIEAQIPTGKGCEGIDVTPDGLEVWTSNKEAETLSIIDVLTNRVVATLPVAGRPIRVKITPDGRRALVSCVSRDQLAVIDVKTRREIQRIPVGRAPIGLVIEPNGQRAYVAETEEDRIRIINLVTLAPIGQIAVGREPDGMDLAIRKLD